jgi:hypothetical protein
MSSFLETDIKRQRQLQREGKRIQNGLPLTEVQKFSASGGHEYGIRPYLAVGAKGAESGDQRRQIRRPFHSDC